MHKTVDEWVDILRHCGVRPVMAETWAPHFSEVIDDNTFSSGPDELPMFLGQVLHESGMLRRLEENLNYSPERLMAVWPRRFPTFEAAQIFAWNPPKLAERVYGKRLGNILPGDAFKYRGSGLIMVTGKDNFVALEEATGLPLLENPDLLRRPGAGGLQVCIAWWEGNVPDGVMGDVVKVTREVNGGTIGLEDRTALTTLAEEALA